MYIFLIQAGPTPSPIWYISIISEVLVCENNYQIFTNDHLKTIPRSPCSNTLLYFKWFQAFGHISGAHLNPAVTLAAVILRVTSPIMAIVYIAAQFIGAVLGFALLKVRTFKFRQKWNSLNLCEYWISGVITTRLRQTGFMSYSAQPIDNTYTSFFDWNRYYCSIDHRRLCSMGQTKCYKSRFHTT